MAKQTNTTTGKGLAAAKRAAKAPVTTPAASTPVQPVLAPPASVALRGRLPFTAIALANKPYRVGASHNAGWWQQCTQAIAAGQGQATVATLVQAGVPAIFVGYVVRRGYAVAA